MKATLVMNIAKIIASNSHIDYVARVIDELDAEEAPRAEDCGFAQFVEIALDTEKIVGVIYDSKLVNPEYANYGPRLSPKPALENFSPDYLNEQGILIGILLLGSFAGEEKVFHGIPNRIIPSGQNVKKMEAEAVKKFHAGEDGALRMHYYSQITAHAGSLSIPLLETITKKIAADCSEKDKQLLAVLNQNLSWQRTFAAMR